MRLIATGLVGALVLGAAIASAQAPGPPTPIVRTEGLMRLSPHVQVIPDGSTPLVPNVGFIVGSEAVLVVDTGLGARNGTAVAAVAARIAPGKALYLVTTHAHPEHDLGAQGFPASAKLIRSAAEDADIRASGLALARLFAARSPATAELLAGAAYRPTDIGYETTYDLDLGGVTARLISLGSNHTDGDTAVWVAADRVLFSGDVAMKGQPSLMASRTSIAKWNASLDQLEALKPAIIVPSHGAVGDVGYVRDYRAYLAEVRERTLAAKANGADLSGATARVTAAMAARFPDAARLAGAVKVAFADGA